MALSRTTLKLASELNRAFQRQIDEYDEACRIGEFNEFGQRLRPHYCEHGVNMWVDYDCACGSCEMGYSFRDGKFRMETAISEAKRRMARIHEIMAATESLRKNGMGDMLDYERVGKEIERLLHVA